LIKEIKLFSNHVDHLEENIVFLNIRIGYPQELQIGQRSGKVSQFIDHCGTQHGNPAQEMLLNLIFFASVDKFI